MLTIIDSEASGALGAKNTAGKRFSAAITTVLNFVFALNILVICTISASQLLRRSNELAYVFIIAAVGSPWPMILGILLVRKIKKLTQGFACRDEVAYELSGVQSHILFLCYFVLQFLVWELSNATGVIFRLGFFGSS